MKRVADVGVNAMVTSNRSVIKRKANSRKRAPGYDKSFVSAESSTSAPSHPTDACLATCGTPCYLEPDHHPAAGGFVCARSKSAGCPRFRQAHQASRSSPAAAPTSLSVRPARPNSGAIKSLSAVITFFSGTDHILQRRDHGRQPHRSRFNVGITSFSLVIKLVSVGITSISGVIKTVSGVITLVSGGITSGSEPITVKRGGTACGASPCLPPFAKKLPLQGVLSLGGPSPRRAGKSTL